MGLGAARRDISRKDSDFVSLALKEEDRKVFTEAIRIFRDHVSLIPSEKRKLLKDAIVERLRKEENEQLLLVSVGFLGAIKSFTTIITETPGFWKKIVTNADSFRPSLRDVFHKLPISEKESLLRLIGPSFSEGVAYLRGYKIAETADPSLVKEIYHLFRDLLPLILIGLDIVLPKENYFLKILPEKERKRFQNVEDEKNRRALGLL